MIAVLGHVDDISKNLAACTERIPQQLENAARHVGVANQAMRCPQKFWLMITRKVNENTVHIRQSALQIGFTDDDFVFPEKPLNAARLYQSLCTFSHAHLIQTPIFYFV